MISMAEGEKSDEEVSQLFTNRADWFYLWEKYDRKLIMNHLHKLQFFFSCIGRRSKGIIIELFTQNKKDRVLDLDGN
jgi:hypothetical protein